MSITEVVPPALAGLAVALAASVLFVATKRWHGRLTFDSGAGPQKVHEAPTPRVGGLALYAGLLAAAAAAVPPARGLLLLLAVSSLTGFAAGVAEDLSKKISPGLRMLAIAFSGWSFCILSGYSVTRLDFSLIDGFLSLPLVSVAFTVFVMAGLANAINIIDGFHGLAAGTVIIMLCAFGIVAFRFEDHDLAMVAIMAAAAMSGFLLVNFPFGHLFLGDGGAYLSGLVLGALAVMLAERNPGISAWTIAVILYYPVVETLASIARKTIRSGFHPGQPDELHLHMLIYRNLSGKLGRSPAGAGPANPLTGAIMWGGAALGLVFVLLCPFTREWAIAMIALQTIIYAAVYYHYYITTGRII